MAGPDGIRQSRPTVLRRPQKLEDDRARDRSGKRIASASNTKGDHTVRVWDAGTGQPVGQSRTPRANSTEARRDEDVHRLVSDVEQLIGIHADALFREPNPAGHCGCCRARRPVRGSVHRIALVSGDLLVTEVHQRPRIAIAGAQYRAASPPLTSGSRSHA